MSEALKQIERAIDRLAQWQECRFAEIADFLSPIEDELEMGLALAREEWRRDQTVKERLARLTEAVSDIRVPLDTAGKALAFGLGRMLVLGLAGEIGQLQEAIPTLALAKETLFAALREARYSEDIGYGDTLDDDIKARTR